MKDRLLYVLITANMFLIQQVIYGQTPNLGTTSPFALYTGGGAINNSGVTTIKGDIGTHVGAFNGFPPGIIIGQIHISDPAAAQALADVGIAYSDLSAVPCGSVLGVALGNNQILSSGVYCTGAASTITGNLILDGGGNPNAVFIFKIGGALSTSTLSSISLINGASLCNVFWQIDGAIDLGTSSIFRGTIVANGAISLLQGATLIGRGLSTAGAINLDANIVDVAMRATVPIINASGPTTFCTGGSVILSGNDNAGIWSTGATTPSITVSISGTYTLTNTANCGSSTASVNIIVNQLPICTITGNSSFCQGQTTQLCTPLSATATYLWSTGATTNCINVNTAGTYSVTVTEGGCQSICSKIITANQPPICTITGNSSLCNGQSIQLCTPLSATATYLWSTGATTNCINVNTAGTYSVTVTEGGCQSVCSKIITANQPPICTITGNSSFCQGQTTQLCTPLSATATYLWSTGATTNCINVNTAGTYSVTVTEGGCQSVCNKIITANQPPICTITGNSFLCNGQSIQLCTPLSATATYLWSTGATTNCINVNTAGTYSVTVTEGGCQSVCSKIITANQPPICTITGGNSLCNGQSIQLCTPLSATATYLWSTGATTNCINVNTAGTYSVTVTEGGCQSICSKIITANQPPICTITGNSSFCQGQTTQLCTPLSATATYLWSTGATTNCINVNTAGTYSVTVTEGGCQSVCSKIITANQPPICTITGNSFLCNGQSIQLCTPLSATATYLWSTGATTNCINVNTAGTYSVTVTEGGCQSVCSKIITANQPPICTITGGNSLCNGQSIQLCTPLSATATYLWSTGATTNCINVNTAGTYSVTVTEGGCQSICSKIITANQPPICTITGNSSLCNGQSIQLCTPLSATATYLWSTGATTNCINVNTAGTYSVTVTEGGCQSVCSKIITVNQPPICTITGNSSLCNGQSIQLCTPLYATATYLWSTGATTNCINVNTAGTYSVTVTEGGCQSICSKIITANQPPICTITGNSSFCQGQTTQLCTPLSATATYLWSTGATTNCINVNTAGTYSVTVTEGGCQSVCSKIITANQPPICTITGNSSFCQGQTTQLCTPLSATATYLWSTGATTNCINVNTAGTYSVTVTEGGCQSICSKIITANQPPICTITGGNSLCNGQSIQLCTPLSATATYLWSTGATTNCINVNTAGTYSVTVTEGGCQSICSKIITANQPPICTITGNSSLCNGQSIQLCTPLSATATYLWSTGATTNCINVNTAGTYSVTVTEGGCQSICSKIITANQPPICTITGGNSLCNGQSIQLCTPLSATATYLWNTGATTNCINVNTAGTYSVTVTEGGCQSVCSKIITANQPPICTITGNSFLCNGQSIQLCTPLSATATYLWSTGATTNCINVNTAGTYSVTVTEGGCQSICSKIITANQPPICTITGGNSLCNGQSIQLCTPLSATATYLWSTGATTNCINVNTAGTYSVTVTEGGCQSICSKIITANQPPICTITGNSFLCNGQSIQLCTPLSATATYLWSTGATTNCINVNTAGNYSVTVTEGGCQSICSKIITANQPPICTITGNSSLCNGQSIQLCTPLSATATYLWSTGATTNCINVNTAGTYSVTVTEGGCQSVCSKIITANQPPICTITGNSSLCNGQSIQLCTPLSATATYLWSTGATTNCINVNTAGTYSVTVTEGGCQSVCSKIITANQPPSCTITGNSSLCNGQTTQLCTPLSATATYLWSTGATTNCINVNTAGTYSVTVTEGGCQSVCSKIITANQPPSCTITGGNSLCNGQSIQLCTPLSATATYLWSTGATTNCINVNTAGTYSVTVTEGGCQSVCSKIITGNQPPICTITGNSFLCNGQSIQLCTPLSATATYLWNTGATTNCINVNTAGTYSVTVTEGGCQSICSKIITANQPPICTITGNSSLCNGQSIQLCTPLYATATYLWSTGATTNCINVNTAGTYSVTVTEGGCQSVCSKIITANQPPICTITGNSSLCNGQSIQLCTPLYATATYLWSTGATTNCINVNTAGTYSVTVTEGGCQSVCSKIITANQPPICTIAGGNSLCNGQSIQLCTPLSATATYLWSTGATTNCINVNTAGTYSVTVTEGGCQSICSKTVRGELLPNCQITGNCNICTGQTTELCVAAGASAYLWSTGATTNCITVDSAGDYSVTVTNANGCTSVCNRAVIINEIPICTLFGYDTICQGQTRQLCVPIGALTYLWSTGATTNCITVNASGFYCVTITNSSGCISICSKTITVLPAIVLTTTVVNAACLATGSITVTASGGIAPYSYLWSSGQTTATINNLSSGVYTVSVTDAKGCVAVKSVTITSPNLRCDIRITQQMSGQNTNDAQAQVVGSLGLAPYTYLWSNGATSQTVTGLSATTYSVTVTDANGCKSICSILIPNNICDNITDAGTICCSQTICNESELQPITEISSVSGGSTTEPIEYLWMYNYASGNFNPSIWMVIDGAIGKDLPVDLMPSITRKTYVIRCVRRANCGDFKESNPITITPLAFANIVGPTTACLNQSVTFAAEENVAGSAYSWGFLGATVSSSYNQVQTVQFTSYGLHQVLLTVNALGCQKTQIISVNVTNCLGVYGNFLGFVASVNHKDALLNWTTSDEQKPSMYMVEKSLDNINFTMIGGLASQNGANNFYTYTDKNPKVGRTYYRIYQMSPFNETLTVSKTEKIMIDEGDKSIITYPNPVGSTLFVEVLAENTEGVLEMYDVLGRVVKIKNFVKDQVRYELEVGDLVSGNYIIRVRFSDGKSVATKVLKF